MSVYFFLPPSDTLTYYWKDTLLGFLSLDDYREDVVTASIAAVLDVDTQDVIVAAPATLVSSFFQPIGTLVELRSKSYQDSY